MDLLGVPAGWEVDLLGVPAGWVVDMLGAAAAAAADVCGACATQGIRPAAGYPSQPDHTEKRTMWDVMKIESEVSAPR